MDFYRHTLSHLFDWKKSPNRKPLILRGARQVGKTTLVKVFAKSYSSSMLLNLDRPSDLAFFQKHDDAKTIIEALFLSKNIPLNRIKDTLLFIDEIQESPRAIQLLRYFYEDIPDLQVIAAGSLLEFVMHKIKNFPVGRIEYLYLYPLNFGEYLGALGHQSLQQLNQVPVAPFAHPILLDLFNRYALLGGMPEVVKNYIGKKSIVTLPKIYESIWSTYRDDVKKYATNVSDGKVIKYIMEVAHLYVDQRVKFQNFGNSNYRSREVGEALRNLDDAKIIRLIYPSTDIEMPLKPDIKKSPRLQFLDTGIVNYALGIQADMLALKDLNSLYKGAIIPHLIMQEIISLQSNTDKKPNFWVREKNQSSAEVDIIVPYKQLAIPVEIKSGSAGKLKSLHQFIERAAHPYAVRLYAGSFSIEEHKTPGGKPYLLLNMPYYLGTKIHEYIDYFVNRYPM